MARIGDPPVRPPEEGLALRVWPAGSEHPARPHTAPPASSTTSRRPRKRPVRSPSTPRSPSSSAASAAGPSVPSAWRPPGSWRNTGGCPAGPWLRRCLWWIPVGPPGVCGRPGRAGEGRPQGPPALLPLGDVVRDGTTRGQGSGHPCVGRCHQGAITSLVISPDGSLLFSACSQGTLAQYHCAATSCRVLRVAG